jgi:CHASE2 domain-containing sensor protein/signal transduction histidine kinase
VIQSHRWRPGPGERFTLGVVLVGLALLLVQQDWLWRWDRVFYDAEQRLWNRPAAEDIVIIAIDEATLREFGRWPWSRRVHADLLRALNEEQPRAIAFDIIFAEPDPGDTRGDSDFARAIKTSGRVILPVLMEQPRVGSQPVETLPLPALANAAAALGHVHVELDSDGIARELFLYAGLGSPRWPHISLAMLQAAGEPAVQIDSPDLSTASDAGSPLVWFRRQPLLIPFAGPPGHFQHISYNQVIKGAYAPGTFRDKYVLIGTTAAGLGDALPTPLSGFSHSMPGVEINANILDALRNGLTITPLDTAWRMALSGLLAVLPLLLFPRRAPRTNLLITALLLLLCVFVSAGLLLLFRYWFPPTAALLAVALSYPLWSWRRLELAMRYLSQELDQLNDQQSKLPAAPPASLTEAIEFTRRLLPIDAWSLQDSQGLQLASSDSGQAFPPRPGGATPWQLEDGYLWLQPHSDENTLTLHWSGEQGPDSAQKQLLTRLSGLLHPVDATDIQHPEKDVQARINQVQQATLQLSELRRFIDDSLANMADGVIVANTFGLVMLSNARAAWYLRGDDDAHLNGLPVSELLKDLNLEQGGDWMDLMRRCLLEGARLQSSVRHRSGRDLLVQIAPLNAGDSAIAGLIFNFSDISPLKASERKRNELLNFLSHDLRSPLVSTSALIELARSHKPAAEIVSLLDRMANYTGNTLALAEQFLQLARAESSESFTFREVDMMGVAINALEQVWGQAQSKLIELHKDCNPEEEAWMVGDGGLLERAMVNLLDNAIKYSEPGTVVTLGVRLDKNTIHCCVSDQGQGIAAEQLPNLFERFQRAGLSEADRQRGAGLGLAFVDVVARQHGGRVTVSSTPGQGSRFCLVLPSEADKNTQGADIK